MEEFIQPIVAYIGAHPHIAALVIGAVAFGESFAFINLFFPGSAVLVAAGTMVKTGVLDPVTVAAAAAGGAVIGDVLSYWIGHLFGEGLPHRWPFRTHPAAMQRGVNFFHRYGWPSVFIGRFFGPLRAFVTLVAGMFRMGLAPFLAASTLSAAIWAPGLLFSGYLLSLVYAAQWTMQEKLLAFAGAAVIAVVLVYATRRLIKAH